MSLRGAIAEAVVLIRADGSEFQGDVVRQGTTAGTRAGSAFGEHFKRRAKAAIAVGGAAIFAGVAAGLRTGFGELTDYETGLSNLRAGLKSTDRQSNTTAKGMEKLASRIQAYSGQTDDSIVKTEQLLLTFTNIRNEAGKNNDIFNQTTKIAADMAQRMGGDASSAAIQLGKALNDPVKGITALTRVGVSFTEEQKKQIEQLVKHGDTLKAQKIILHELNTEFGGSARLYGHTLPGQLDRTKRAYEDITQELATDVLPYALDFTKWIRKDALPALEDFGGWVKDHKKELEWFGGILAGAAVSVKALKGVRSIQSLLGGGGVGRGVLGGALKSGPVPVYVTNWGKGPGGMPIPGGKPGGGRRSILPGVGSLALAYAATQGGDMAPGQQFRVAGGNASNEISALIRALNLRSGDFTKTDPTRLAFDRDVYTHGGAGFDLSQGVDYLRSYGSKQDVSKLKELAKIYPEIGAAVKAGNLQQKALNQYLIVQPGLAKNAAAAHRLLAGGMREVSAEAKIEAAILGHDLGRGLIRGIEAEIPHANVAGKLLVAQTVKSMRLAADANSPSRETQALGHDIGDGLIKGLRDRRASIRNEILHLGDDLSELRGKAQSLSLGIRGAVLGDSSILNTPNQSIGGIKDYFRHTLQVDRRFKHRLDLLRDAKIPKGLINALAGAGPAQAGNIVRQLSRADMGDDRAVAHLYREIRQTARGTGLQARQQTYDPQIGEVVTELRRLNSRVDDLGHEIRGAQHTAHHRTHH